MKTFEKSLRNHARGEWHVARGKIFLLVTLSICGERPTPNAVCTSSGLHSLRPCLEQGAAQVKRPSWQTQGGRVRSLALLNSLQK